ncbi:hypothetical protein EGH51_24090 [Klebsiella aerogenes]|nr:hypothetical protein EGH51_24090 [Klebsiella aerogenes]
MYGPDILLILVSLVHMEIPHTLIITALAHYILVLLVLSQQNSKLFLKVLLVTILQLEFISCQEPV